MSKFESKDNFRSSNDDQWNSDRPKEAGRAYDGPAGMEPEGLIESNWEQVKLMALNIYFKKNSCSVRLVFYFAL